MKRLGLAWGMMARAAGCVCILEVTAAMAAPSDKLPTASGQWWQYRGDQWLSGRSRAVGNITQPAIRWRYPLLGRDTLLAATLQPGPEYVVLPLSDRATEGLTPWGDAQRDWRLPGPYRAQWLDLDGNGDLTAVSASPNAKLAKLLPDIPGLQMVECEPRGYPKVPNVYEGTVRLKVRQGGQWVTRWEVATDQLIWQAEPIAGDFDGDGRTEIALLPWYEMFVLDAATGREKERCRFLAQDGSEIPGHGGRAYGWFGAHDVDGDGQTEFVIIEDFIRYAAVLGRDGDGKLQRRWLKVWEPAWAGGEFPAPDEQVLVRVNPQPLQDIDGDGLPEIVVSLFNLHRDNRWHVVALSAATGETKLDLEGQFLAGLQDLDGDGTPELFCTHVGQGPRLPEPAELTVLSCRGGQVQTLWRSAKSAFVTQDLVTLPDNVNTGATLGGLTVLCGRPSATQPPVFFTRTVIDAGRGTTGITCWQGSTEGKIVAVADWIGPRLQVMAAQPESGVLLRASGFDGEPGEVRIPDGRAQTRVVASNRTPAPSTPLVTGRPTPEAPPAVFVQSANETVEAFRVFPPGNTQRLWRAPGRGMTCSNYYEGLLLADLTGDGHLGVVAGTRGPGDCARLVVLEPETGVTRWYRDFRDFPGAPPPWNVPGLMYWQGGYFRDPNRMDLLVQMRRIGGESYLLDGRTARMYWQRARGRTGRDFGRWWMALLDVTGDGLDDILNVYPDMFCLARGSDGELLVAEESVKYVDIYAYWSDTVVGDFLGEGAPQILYCNEFVTALLRPSGERVWKLDHPHPEGWRNQAGFGDVDGDGRLELFFPGAATAAGRQFQCRDAATGELKWAFPVPDEPVTFPAVADINGDGRDECIFTQGRAVWAVGRSPADATQGAVLWKLELPARAGAAAIADVDGTGQAQVVVMADDGIVYGIAQTPAE